MSLQVEKFTPEPGPRRLWARARITGEERFGGLELRYATLRHYDGRPEVGLPATHIIGTDWYAMQVTYVSKGGCLVKARRWNYAANDSTEHGYTKRRDGAFRQKGSGCGRLIFGIAEDYRDPEF